MAKRRLNHGWSQVVVVGLGERKIQPKITNTSLTSLRCDEYLQETRLFGCRVATPSLYVYQLSARLWKTSRSYVQVIIRRASAKGRGRSKPMDYVKRSQGFLDQSTAFGRTIPPNYRLRANPRTNLVLQTGPTIQVSARWAGEQVALHDLPYSK
jgi:hypothetical protein